MPGFRIPGSIGLGGIAEDWIDTGTMCRARSPTPGPLGLGEDMFGNVLVDAGPLFNSSPLSVGSGPAVARREPSGVQWVSRFPTSADVGDLQSPFREDVRAFIAAIAAAGGTVQVAATLRPPERAYLMHFCAKLAAGKISARSIPAMAGVDIQWDHGTDTGSRAAARAMRDAYEIVYPPALKSNHSRGLAIDMRVTGVIGKSVADKAGKARAIQEATDLHAVGASYGVHKLVSDPPHWSHDGH